MDERAERLSIVMACDEGYAMPLATALRSIANSNQRHWPLDVYVISDGFREQTKERIRDSLPAGALSLHWLHISLDRFSNLATLSYISRMTFARFLLSDLLPRTVKRIIYLDADLLVLKDLAPLWAKSLEGNSVGAVVDYGLDPMLKRHDPKCAGMPRVKSYFNAGVFLIDLEIWRTNQVGERAAQYLVEHPKSPYADQDALNVVLDGAWTSLPGDWNFQGHLGVTLTDIEPALRPGIVHFITAMKPWKREFGTPNEALFDSYRRQTQFARTLGMRLSDAWRSTWFLVKQELKRSPQLRQTLQRLKPRA